MTTLTRRKRPTVYLEPDVHKALRQVARETPMCMSDYVNAAVREELRQDAADLAIIEARRDEPGIPLDQFVAELKREGII